MPSHNDLISSEFKDELCEECKDELGLIYDEDGTLLCEDCFFYKMSIGDYEKEEI